MQATIRLSADNRNRPPLGCRIACHLVAAVAGVGLFVLLGVAFADEQRSRDEVEKLLAACDRYWTSELRSCARQKRIDVARVDQDCGKPYQTYSDTFLWRTTSADWLRMLHDECAIEAEAATLPASGDPPK